jgi:hypothetical protein
MAFDDAYDALTDHEDDSRWAYGTGFADPLAGVSTAVPSDVDRTALATYCLMLGDDALVLSHRLQQWVTRAPELEAELALPGGHIFHRDLSWPFAEDEAGAGTWGVETAHPNVLLCGAGARRGGGVSGIPGHNAAMAVLGAAVTRAAA